MMQSRPARHAKLGFSLTGGAAVADYYDHDCLAFVAGVRWKLVEGGYLTVASRS